MPKGLGTALIAELGIAPGPRLGDLMDLLREDVESGRLGVQQDYTHYVQHVRNDPARFAPFTGAGK